MAKGSPLATTYPTAEEWRALLKLFSPQAIAHKLLLSHVPYVFKDEPLKFALFRRTIADAFNVEPTNVFIVGSAMAGRSLKGQDIEKTYSPSSDIDTLIVSEHVFTAYVMKSLEWVESISRTEYKGGKPFSPTLQPETTKHIHWLAEHAMQGIWRPDSLPKEAPARREFFERFAQVSLKTLGLQLSDDTVARVNGRIARSFDDAIADLSDSLDRLRREFKYDDAHDGDDLNPKEQA
jgi:hypothetical protein